MMEVEQKDLVILVADNNMQHAIRGLLSRYQSLAIRQVTYDIYVHPERDPGCRLRSHEFLRPFVHLFVHALVMFDRQGCGAEEVSREVLENEVQSLLSHSGWGDRAEVVVLDPELEVWVWTTSPWVERILGWAERQPDLRTWLRGKGFCSERSLKPADPKTALEQALRVARRPRSSSRYQQLAQRVSLPACTDPAFIKFKTILNRWFRQEV